MKKLVVLLSLLTVFTLVGCTGTVTDDKETNPESGVVVFIGYDKSLYFVVEDDSAIYGDEGSGYIEINFPDDTEFTTNDVYYKFVFKDKKELNEKLKQFGHKEI